MPSHASNSFLSPEPDLEEKSVLVTGGTGSFGKGFVKAVLERYRVRRLIVFSRDELKQFDMAQTFPVETYPAMRYFLGDVRDRERLEMAMRGVDYVIHAAALKQVPAAEYNPFECICTNVMGAENVVRAAISSGVKRVVALSTDKAANPINLYGASKLASDKIFVAANHVSGADGPIFSVVRYGNVLGSRGSVVPFFQKLIREKAEALPITHPDMTRFWITLRQGVNFVLSSLAMMQGGEIFVPKIPSMTMVGVAKAMAPDLPHKIVGIRPGEKLHELMITEDDARHTYEMADRYLIAPSIFFSSRDYASTPGTVPVQEPFSYASNRNPITLDTEAFLALMAESAAAGA